MTKRSASIESFRVLAILSVILMHTGFVSSLSKFADGQFLVVLTGYLVWWVGVPYFLITAGYFFRQSIATDENPIAQLRRYVTPLAWMLLGWMCIYIVMSDYWPGEVVRQGLWQPFYSEALKNMHLLATENISLFLEGRRPIWHLWFLPALMFSLTTLTLMTICRLEKYLVPLIISLYVLALTEEIAGGHSFNSSLHVGTWSIALLFTAIGWLFAKREQPSATVAWSLIIAGYAAALMEGEVLNIIFHMALPTLRWHFFLGGIILALGIFQLALAKPKMGQSTPFPFLARFTLGVYLSHIFVLYTLRPIDLILGNGIPLRGALTGIIVYIFSVLFVVVLARIPILKYLVVKPTSRHQRKTTEENPLTNKSLSDYSGSRTPPHAV
jgi:surface polysaccharide O-acyltransferase-like enzyme